MKVINMNGIQIDFDAAIPMMDGALLEDLINEMAPCTEQAFFAAYEQAHAVKYGAEWELSKANPVW